MLNSTVESVRCVEGCGGDSTVTAIALVVALLSLAAAVAAWSVSQRSLAIAGREHQIFVERLNARADFVLDLYLAGGADGHIVESDQPHVWIKWQMGMANSGQKAAEAVGVNFVVPGDLDELAWVRQDSGPVSDPRNEYGPMSTAEELPTGSGLSAQYLAKKVDRVSLRDNVVAFAMAAVPMPANPGEERQVIASFRVWSDDLPEDIPDQRAELTITLRRT